MEFNKNQLKAIKTVNGNVIVMASAGSGKSSVLVHRIKNLIEEYNIPPQNILAITFSRKAKESMSDKLEKITTQYNNVNIETFHSLSLKIIQSNRFVKLNVWQKQWEKEKVLGDICIRNNIYSSIEDISFNDIFRMISIAKNEMSIPTAYMYEHRDFSISLDNIKIIYNEYEKYKKYNSLIDFDDFLNLACEMLEDNPELLTEYQNKFKYILSDEYQDTSKNKAKLIDLLGRKNGNIFVVGDFLQNIYSSFTGSDNKFICKFKEEYDAEVINLNINYRCSEDIVKVSNKFALTIPETKHPNYVESIADKPKFKQPEFTECDDITSECKYIIDKIKKFISNGEYKYSDIGILARTNAMLQSFEISLSENKIPYNMNDGISFLEEPEIKLILSYLKLANNEYDNTSFEYCFNKPNRWLAKQFLEEVKSKCTKDNNSYYLRMSNIDRRNWRFKNGIDELYEVINALQNKKFANLAKAVSYLRNRLDIDEFIANKNLSKTRDEITDNLDSFEEICKEYRNLDDIIKYFNKLEMDNKNNTSENKLNLMTIHKSKGLEFPVVFLIGCNENYIPHQKSIDIDEERRLFYVGMTRAEKELYLSSANFRKSSVNAVSRFIRDIEDDIKVNEKVFNEEDKKCNLKEQNKKDVINQLMKGIN